jgi:hypothetical protein
MHTPPEVFGTAMIKSFRISAVTAKSYKTGKLSPAVGFGLTALRQFAFPHFQHLAALETGKSASLEGQLVHKFLKNFFQTEVTDEFNVHGVRCPSSSFGFCGHRSSASAGSPR